MNKAPEYAPSGDTERIDAPDLGPLPVSYATSVTWRNPHRGSWQQWHDREDPMPTVWDDRPPDEVVPVYTADQMRAERARTYAAGAADFAEADALREKLGDILRRTAIALRGPEPPLTRWSWHDLPERAAGAAAGVPAAVARQALEALESVFDGDGKGAEFWSVTGGTYEAVECKQAIRALRAALASPTPPAEPIPETIGVQFIRLIAEIWRQKPNAGIREVLDELNAQFGRPGEADDVRRMRDAAPPQATPPAEPGTMGAAMACVEGDVTKDGYSLIAPPAEPDMRHPKIQALLGIKARREIELRLVEKLLDDPDCDLTAIDMEYWHSLHDRLRDALLTAAPPQATPPAEPAEPALIKAAKAMVYACEQARIWNGMGWHYNPLHPMFYEKPLETLRAALYAAPPQAAEPVALASIRSDFETHMRAQGFTPTALTLLPSGTYMSATVHEYWLRTLKHFAPVQAQAAEPAPGYTRGDIVRKRSGAAWEGRVCGEYSTALTPQGYAVESCAHAGSVQIYPAAALELVTRYEPPAPAKDAP